MKGWALGVARVVVGLLLAFALWLVFSTAEQARAEAGSGSIGGIVTLAGAVAACFWSPFLIALRGRVPLAPMAIVVAGLLYAVIAASLYSDPYASGDPAFNIGLLLFFAIPGAVVAFLTERSARSGPSAG